MTNDWVYDTEEFPNVFTIAFEHVDAPIKLLFEISDWRNDSQEIISFLHYLKNSNARMIGFNNIGWDYPILHTLIRMGKADAATLYSKAQAIINSQDDDSRWIHRVNPSDRFIEQIDLYLINHFDNKARATGLKALEFAMKSDNISDLPFPVGIELTQDQLPVLKRYNAHDVSETKKFLHHSTDMLRFREELARKYPGRDWLNFNDTKIGKVFFEMKLEDAGVQVYEYGPEGRKPKQTPRPVIHLRDAILPWIEFGHPEFRRVLSWFKEQSITETKGVFTDVVARVDGFDFVFGLGGIHGSVESEVIESDDEFMIVDLDVSSYYPNLAITNSFYPEHLGGTFPVIYKSLYEQRKQYAKTSAENAMLKLALNGTYGDSNNRFGIFYDPLFTMRITLNGQLLLCVLAEGLMTIEGLKIIQVNTDGLTVRIPRHAKVMLDAVASAWQQRTGLELEEVEYRRMFIRDVNNYVAESMAGKVKRKGAYEYKRGWHQDQGALVVPKVVEKVLLEGAPIRETVENWPDRYDFMMRVKVPRTSHLQWGDAKVQNTSRYYIAKGGQTMFKWMPPLKGKTEWRRIGVESGWTVQVCNDIKDATLPVDHEYYIREVEKLVNILS